MSARRLVAFAGVVLTTALTLSAQGTQPTSPFSTATQLGPGITGPVELKFTEPKYTDAARDAGIEGMVVLEAVIDTSGKVANARVVQSLDKKYGLDEEALKAVNAWLFKPATKDGKPVPMIVQLELMFRLPRTGPDRAVVARPPQERIKLPDDGFATGAYAWDTLGLKPPVEKRFSAPKYTMEAMRAKIQGTVVVEVVIGTDGTVTKARVFETLDKVNGLDEAALATVKTWTFEPGTLGGQTVPVYARLDVMFRLH
jgi:TonB family protein